MNKIQENEARLINEQQYNVCFNHVESINKQRQVKGWL